MLALSFTFETSQVTQATANRILRETNREGGEYIAKTLLPGKFKEQAYYQGTAKRRSRKYVERKRRKVGHDKPLVYSGKLQEKVLSKALSGVTATRNGGKVPIRGTFPMPDRMRQELEVLSQRDTDRLGSFMERTLTSKLNDPKNQRKRRRRNSDGTFATG